MKKSPVWSKKNLKWQKLYENYLAFTGKKGRRHVAEYIRKMFGIQRVKEFRQDVDQIAKTLMQHPNLGSIDPLFNDRPVTFRSVVINGLSKMVYRVDDEVIHIVGFWDTRREPKKQAEQVE